MSYQLTKEQIDELQEAFTRYDLDGNGSISPHEMRLALISVGHETTEAELYDLINTVAVGGNQDLDLPEFMKMMAPRIASVESDENLRRTFRLFDRDDDGYVTGLDVRAIMVMLGVVVTDEEVKDICCEVDGDHDGLISLRDFMNFMHSPI